MQKEDIHLLLSKENPDDNQLDGQLPIQGRANKAVETAISEKPANRLYANVDILISKNLILL